MQVSVLLVLLSVYGAAKSQEILEGQCPNPPVKQGFEVQKYLGRWYEVQRTEFVIFELDQVCVQATYTLKDNGRIRVENLAYNTVTNETVGALGEAYPADPSEPAKLLVDFGAGPAPYWVLNTDYTQFSVVYSCSNVTEDTYSQIIWILGRTRTLSDDVIESAKTFMNKLNINTDAVVPSDQKNCD